MQSPLRLIVALVLVALPLLELALLIKAGQAFGFWPVVLTVISTGLLGARIIQTQGIATIRRVSDALESGREPHRELADGALRLLAGGLLLLPGPLTDTTGALLMIAPLRSFLATVIFARATTFAGTARGSKRWPPGSGQGPGRGPDPHHPDSPDRGSLDDGEIIEGEFERLDERTVDPARHPPRRPRSE